MAAMRWFLLAITCLCAQAFPDKQIQRSAKTTVFLDEKLEGQIFENLMDESPVSARNDAANVYRLPTTTRPYHYNIDWIVDTTELTFGGTVAIQLYATQANINEIVIQSDDLSILNVTLTRNNVVVPHTYYLQPDLDFLRIELVNGYLDFNANNPTAALYVLTVEFEAELRHDMYGIYRSWFRNDNYTETPSFMATTQFQATSARRAFPCYDEPSFKATFDISITRRRDVRSWSCMRLENTDNTTYGTDFEVDTFYRTPVMSTYLLAIIVADYDTRGVNNSAGELVYEVIARPAAIEDDQHIYALDVGQELLAEMSNHTAIDYYFVENLKMTQAAIPDFGAGAMENWGLLTYREAYLMYHDNHTNSNSKQLIAYILSHEIAHMWFGNLVTCDWWDVLWLNEGFARYYQYFLTDWVEDYMGFETRFITEQVHTSLLSDSVVNAHPLSTSGIGSPAQVSSMFSTLTYNKGAAVIRMTEHLLGFEVHRQGLRNYLADNAFGTALPIDLFEALQNASVAAGAISEYGPDFSVIDYYKTWTEQGGHPVLNVQVDQQTGQLFISQRRFDINNGYSTPLRNWIVPITFVAASNPYFNNTKPTHIMTEATMTIDANVFNEWVVLNTQQTGFYRVNYDDYTWNLIALALQGEARTVIHEYNKAQIVNDVFQFARSGLMSYTRAFSILSFLQYETDYAPWVAAITGFNWLRNRFASTPYLNTLENLIGNWSTAVMNNVTYYPIEGESFMQSYKRMQLAPTMCAIGVPACIEAAETQFANLMTVTDYEVPVDSRTWVYCNALRRGNAQHFNFLWNRFQQHHVYTEKILILSALGCTNDVPSLTTFLNAILEDNFLIRRQDYNTAFNAAVSGNENNTQIVFNYVQENLELLEAAYNVTSSVAVPLSYISARLRTEEEVEEFQIWARQNRNALGNSYNSVINGAESARSSIVWVNEVLDDVLNYIESGGDNLEVTTAIPVTDPVIVTEVRPVITPPPIPELPEVPDSAVTSALSLVAIVSVAIVNLAL